MSDPITAYPLTWPANWRRTAPNDRARARFSRENIRYGSVGAKNGQRLLTEVMMLGVEQGDIIVSTNVMVKLNGLPYSNQKEPSDPGAAVYWRKRGEKVPKCMAIDRYDRVADNLAAIAATISAMRMIERHGGAEVLDRAFLGFQQLPPPFVGQRRSNFGGCRRSV